MYASYSIPVVTSGMSTDSEQNGTGPRMSGIVGETEGWAVAVDMHRNGISPRRKRKFRPRFTGAGGTGYSSRGVRGPATSVFVTLFEGGTSLH